MQEFGLPLAKSKLTTRRTEEENEDLPGFQVPWTRTDSGRLALQEWKRRALTAGLLSGNQYGDSPGEYLQFLVGS